ncbi:MAG: ROK family protein [Oscillospiraceae bacterium]|nr:ROK family protein [Oscillospiraceae bacterium]
MNDQYATRKRNLEAVWNALIHQGRATRQSLADETKLSLMTISSLVALLNERGALTQLTPQNVGIRRSLGRRVQTIEARRDRCGWIAVNLTSLSFTAKRLTMSGEQFLPDCRYEYNAASSYKHNLRDFLERVRDLEGAADALGVAVIAPGPYDVATDTVRNVRIPDLNSVRVKETLREILHCRSVFVEEDVKLSIRAFMPRQDLRRGDTLVYIYLGEGVGGAVAYQGEVLRGQNAVTGDFGQTIGSFGATFESELSSSAFEREARISGKTEAFNSRAAILAQMIHNIMWSVDPTRIVIECQYTADQSDSNCFAERTMSALQDTLRAGTLRAPNILFKRTESPSLAQGVALILSKQWIDDVVMGDRDGECAAEVNALAEGADLYG